MNIYHNGMKYERVKCHESCLVLHFKPVAGKPHDEVDLEDIFDRHGIKSSIGTEPNRPDSTRILDETKLKEILDRSQKDYRHSMNNLNTPIDSKSGDVLKDFINSWHLNQDLLKWKRGTND